MFMWKFIISNNIVLKMFVGIIDSKPSRDFICPLGMPKGLKGLLYMLNAIISSTTADCFAKGLAKCMFEDI